MENIRVSPDPNTKYTGSQPKVPNMQSEIRIADFNFDINGDGCLDPFEKKVMAAFKAADRDNSGTLTPVEMIEIMRSMAESEKTKKRMGRTIFALIGLVVLLVLALVGVSITGAIVGGETIKESKVPSCADPEVSDPRCSANNVVHTASVESFTPSIFALPTASTNQLAYLKDLTMYVDMSSDPAVGGAVEATFKVAGAYKRADTTAYVVTTNGYKIALHSDSQTGTISMDDTTFPVLDTPPSSGGRRLETSAEAPMLETKTARQMAQAHESRRKLFQGALMTSGSFTMMAASAGSDRRDRKLFNGALMSSGSFTMMAAGTGD